MDLDFSFIGVSRLISDSPETISSLLLYHTNDVNKALFEAYKNNPNDKVKIANGFIHICKRFLSPTEKIEFLERWNRLQVFGLFDIARGKIDKIWIDNLNYWLSRIVDNAKENLEIAYQTKNTQYFPEIGNHISVAKNAITPVKKTPGRKPNVAKPVKEYIRNIEYQHIESFLCALKHRFSGSTPRDFIFMIRALYHMEYINVTETSRKEVWMSFESFFGGEYGNLQNKYATWRNSSPIMPKGAENTTLGIIMSDISEIVSTLNNRMETNPL